MKRGSKMQARPFKQMLETQLTTYQATKAKAKKDDEGLVRVQAYRTFVLGFIGTDGQLFQAVWDDTSKPYSYFTSKEERGRLGSSTELRRHLILAMCEYMGARLGMKLEQIERKLQVRQFVSTPADSVGMYGGTPPKTALESTKELFEELRLSVEKKIGKQAVEYAVWKKSNEGILSGLFTPKYRAGITVGDQKYVLSASDKRPVENPTFRAYGNKKL